MSLTNRISSQLKKNQNVQRLVKELKVVGGQLKVRSNELNKKLNSEGNKRLGEALRRYNKLTLKIQSAQEEFEYELHRARQLIHALRTEVRKQYAHNGRTMASGAAAKTSKKTTKKAAKTSKKAARRA